MSKYSFFSFKSNKRNIFAIGLAILAIAIVFALIIYNITKPKDTSSTTSNSSATSSSQATINQPTQTSDTSQEQIPASPEPPDITIPNINK
jgi:Na+/H+-dicarboxylate symporter